MSEIKALEKLRAAGRNIAKGSNLENHEKCNLLLVIADEIQAEIDERFMELPVDADGVPWTLETESFVDDTGREVVFSGLEVDYAGRWRIRSNCVLHDPSVCRHVKPDPLKELLTEMLDRNSDGVGLREFNRDFGAFVAHYADEIRELLGGDAE